MSEGWIKLHRKLLDNALMTKSAYLQLWIALLLRANHKETTFIFNNQKQILKPGQLLIGRKRLSKITGIAQSTIEKILKYLEKEHQIEQHKTRRFRIITITNWQFYQIEEPQKEQLRDNCVTTREQLRDTYKNDKNEKNVKKYGGNFSRQNFKKSNHRPGDGTAQSGRSFLK
ncbi:MAG: hypothetical protein WC476_13625 [Phycisphaerae bacterium]|jgi:DNA-binding transcriptional regulator YhcF (GntR family)